LAAVGARVRSLEIVLPLATAVRKRLDRLGLQKVRTRHGDGYHGWREAAPFDAILVTAAASHIPPPLVRQLKPGGRMVIPVGGGGFSFQHLTLVEKAVDGKVTTRQLLPVRFVPLTGGH
jgi:protein-L-isoaspartate(D-aspartate) O-methyltransferase